jgi:putative tryptophan/tyrosine transport system substrate-binding protein
MERRRSRLNRRAFVGGAGTVGAALLIGCGRLPFQAQPPSPTIYRIGFLSSAATESTIPPAAGTAPAFDAFWQGLHDDGYIEGQNLIVEWRVSDQGAERLREFATELSRLPVDVLVTGLGGSLPAKQATDTILIVFVGGPDPVALGLVASLGRPGGNVTGLPIEVQQNLLSGKQLELLKEVAPGLSRVAVLRGANVNLAAAPGPTLATHNAVAQALGLQVQPLDVYGPGDLVSAFEMAGQAHADGLVFLPTPALGRDEARIAELALSHHLPSISAFRSFAAAGGLMSYGASLPALWRRAAYYVDRILRGAKPADLPVEQPMTFDFVVNLKTAAALGIIFPNEIMLQVTEVVQ